MSLTLQEKIKKIKDIMNKILKKEETYTHGTTPYEELDFFIKKVKQMKDANFILTTLVKPDSGLDIFIRTLIKNELSSAWYAKKTDAELNIGGKTKRKRKSKKSFFR
jgi:hypothetical protein